MLTFQIGDERWQHTEFLGKSVSLDFYRQQPDEVAELLREAGFEPWATREPEGAETSAHGYLMARRP